MTYILVFLSLSGGSFLFWTIIGIFRWTTEQFHSEKNTRISQAITAFLITIHTVLLGTFLLWYLKGTTSASTPIFIGIISIISAWTFSLHVFLRTRTKHGGKAIFILSFFATGILLPHILNELLFPFPLRSFAALILLFCLIIFSAIFFSIKKTLGSIPSQENIFPITTDEVAAIIPAHNEEIGILRTIESLARVIPRKNIYVASDASTDNTVAVSRKENVNVLDIWPNKGKAGALLHTITTENLRNRYKVITLVDADSEISPLYMERGLPLFNDPSVVTVAGHAVSAWTPHTKPSLEMFFPAYRTKFYRVLQAAFRYGQTWKYTSVTPIAPGFCSMYRTSIIDKIDITAPNLVIEDFNMTFEVHHKKLGRIAYHPEVYGVTDDPHSFKDYIKQVKRWDLGFWQTVRRHGVWPSFFWLSMVVYLFELFLYSIFFISLPIIIFTLITRGFEPFIIGPILGSSWSFSFFDIIISVFFVDYILTTLVAWYEKKPMLLLYGIGFPIIRYIDAWLFLYTIPLGLFVRSNGRWVSPKRLERQTNTGTATQTG